MDSFKNLLISAKKQGYASASAKKTVEDNGSISTYSESGIWRFHDNWFGEDSFGGREIVFKSNKPFWMMVYFGVDSKKATETVTNLRKALANMPNDFPARGPKVLEYGDYIYKNTWKGNIDEFTGIERILYKGEEVFQTNYAGGLVY